jgi:transposase
MKGIDQTVRRRRVKTKLSLKERVFCCEACGLVIDRDHNAALNLATLLQHVAPASGHPVGRRRKTDVERVPSGRGRRLAPPAGAPR